MLSAVVKIIITRLYMSLDSKITIVFHVLHHQTSCWDRAAGQVGASLLSISCLMILFLSNKLTSLQLYICTSLFQLTKQGPEYRSVDQELWSYMLNHLPCNHCAHCTAFLFSLRKIWTTASTCITSIPSTRL